jgi:hypothetical protein
MNKKIIAKILFNDIVEYTSIDIKSNKFLIYYRKNEDLKRFELPLDFIDDVVYVDEVDPVIEESIKIVEPEIVINPEINNFDGSGKFIDLQIKADRYLYLLHWFKVPHQLKSILKNNNVIFRQTTPQFSYHETKDYLSFKFIWDMKENKINDKIEDCRVCYLRYLRPTKKFNSEFLKNKYPNLWVIGKGDFKWEVNDNYGILEITWDLNKYKQSIYDRGC